MEYQDISPPRRWRLLTLSSGPAHAVYFATYEVVKQAMGGNAAGHHPISAGEHTIILLGKKTQKANANGSFERCMRNDSQRRLHEPFRRHKAKNASPRINAPLNIRMRNESLPKRGHKSVLCLLSDHLDHDSTVHSIAIHRIRISNKNHAKKTKTWIRPACALHRWRFGWWYCCGGNDAFRCGQDAVTDARNFI